MAAAFPLPPGRPRARHFEKLAAAAASPPAPGTGTGPGAAAGAEVGPRRRPRRGRPLRRLGSSTEAPVPLRGRRAALRCAALRCAARRRAPQALPVPPPRLTLRGHEACGFPQRPLPAWGGEGRAACAGCWQSTAPSTPELSSHPQRCLFSGWVNAEG